MYTRIVHFPASFGRFKFLSIFGDKCVPDQRLVFYLKLMVKDKHLKEMIEEAFPFVSFSAKLIDRV